MRWMEFSKSMTIVMDRWHRAEHLPPGGTEFKREGSQSTATHTSLASGPVSSPQQGLDHFIFVLFSRHQKYRWQQEWRSIARIRQMTGMRVKTTFRKVQYSSSRLTNNIQVQYCTVNTRGPCTRQTQYRPVPVRSPCPSPFSTWLARKFSRETGSRSRSS